MQDYQIPDGRVVSGSPESRAQRNLEAIQVMRACDSEGRQPTSREQHTLANYVGWGAVPQLFAAGKPEWAQAQQQLRALITPEEYKHAQRSTTNAHYTSGLVVDAMWRALDRLGMKSGMTVLEPALGVGNFFGRQPDKLRGGRRVGVEKDTVTGRIAKLLYPESSVLIQPFEEVPLLEDSVDVAISNVPFGNYGVYDPEYLARPWLTRSIHNYFFVKSLKLVRPGGIVAFITSRYTMDNHSPEDKGIRHYLAERAELLAAVRLPETAFRDCAGTSVVADILFLRRLLPDEKPEPKQVWLDADYKSIDYSNGQYVNNYFTANPAAILGEETFNRGQWSSRDYTVSGELDAAALNKALDDLLPRHVLAPYQRPGTYRPALSVLETGAETEKIGGLFFNDRGKLYRRVSESSVELVPVDGTTKQRISGQLGIRDTLIALLDAERTDASTIEDWRAELNTVYDRYVGKFGVLSKRVNQAAIAGDPDAPLLLSLEKDFDPVSSGAAKSMIFSRRVIEPVRPVTSVGTAKEALMVSLNETGGIDWPRMERLTGRAALDLQTELAGLIFEDPRCGEWQTAEEYLSGAVRTKLREAQGACAVDAKFAANVQALTAVLPEDIPPSQIRAALGASWVPLDLYGEFIQDVIKCDTAPRVKYIHGEYHFHEPWSSRASKWATTDVTAATLVRDTMNLRRIKVYQLVDGKSVLDKEATLAARDRQHKLNEYFNEWLLATDEARTAKMTRIYNDRINDLRLRTYDGSHLTLPGMSRACLRSGDLEPYQKAAVWRQVCQPNCYIAHCVGSGKTFETIAGAMELKRLGLIARPMFVVPNQTLSGWQQQFQMLYPGARVIVFSERDLEKERRQRTIARIATSSWDAVVIPHSSFQLIPVGKEMFEQHYAKLEAELDGAIIDARAEGMDTRFIKRLEKQKERLLTALKKRQSGHKDKTVTWEQLNIDHLVVDEAHEYKRLGFRTKQMQVAGIDPDGNQKTFDLLMKVRHVQKYGRGCVFASGTPATNTMGELYNAMQYLIQPELDARGLGRFDEWSAAFGQVVEVFEPKPEGGGYQVKGRFARFVNVPELAQLFRSFADVLTSDMLAIPRPDLAGGERRGVVNRLSAAQKVYMQKLQDRAAAIRKNARAALPDNMVAIYGDAQMMALDVRMVMPSAPESSDSRLNEAADAIARIWRETGSVKGTQLVFSDFGKPAACQRNGLRRFSAYDALIRKLQERSIPAAEIAHIYEARNKHERARLFLRVNAGEIRVLLGSTAKLGIGVNVQERIVAMHHLTVPHRPADLEQREGRGIRQGNRNREVDVRYYITKGSLDELKFANVARKARAFAQFMQGTATVREMEDIDDLAPSLEQFQAAASGDPRVRRKLEVDNELLRLSVLQSAWRDERWRRRRDLNEVPNRISRHEKAIETYNLMAATAKKTGRVWTIGVNGTSKTFSGDGVQAKAGPALEAALRRVKGEMYLTVGTAHGVPMEVNGLQWMRLGGITGFGEVIDVKGRQGAGVIQSVEYYLRNLPAKVQGQRDAIARAEQDRSELEAALAEAWPHETQCAALRREQQELFQALGGGKGDHTAAALDDQDVIEDAAVEAAEPEEDDEDISLVDPEAIPPVLPQEPLEDVLASWTTDPAMLRLFDPETGAVLAY